jgi:hypothetical protein
MFPGRGKRTKILMPGAEVGRGGGRKGRRARLGLFNRIHLVVVK